jgi:hypothetical protein
MTAKREATRTGTERRRRTDEPGRAAKRRPADAPPRTRGKGSPVAKPTRAASTKQAKARAKARKAKAPKAVRLPLKERLIARLSQIDLSPRTLATKVPFVVLVIGSLGIGLGLTLWLSTDSAERSYELGSARETNRALSQQKEALERDVLEAQAAPALAEAARNLGMIPSRDTAHLVQDASGNWVVVGTPKPAQGVSPPPLNTPLPVEKPAPPPRPVDPREVSRMVPRPPAVSLAGPVAPLPTAVGPEVLTRAPAPIAPPGLPVPPPDVHGAGPAAAPGPAPAELIPPADATLPAVPPADAPQLPNPPVASPNGEQSSSVPPQITGPAT